MNSDSIEKMPVLFRVLLRIPVPWVYVLVYLIGVIFHLVYPLHFVAPEKVTSAIVAGVLLFGTGAFIAAWSLIIFRKARTTTTPGESSKQLILKGPYLVSRNPMYVSLLLAYLGEAAFLNQIGPVIIVPLLLAYVDRVVIPLEESVLRKDFGEEYNLYCGRVRRWI
jgi:Putative protein-S-isoprenylcysteine methyltransferase